MLRLCHGTYRRLRFRRARPFCSSSSTSQTTKNPTEIAKDATNHPKSRSSIVHVNARTLSPLSFTSLSRPSILVPLSAIVASAAAASYVLFTIDEEKASSDSSSDQQKLYSTIERTIERSNESAKRIIHRMKETGVAASVLWQSLRSVLSSANYEVRSGFEFRVASFLADIAAANGTRRVAIVAAGGGKVVDWLLETVAVAGETNGTQAEAARALAYLIADPIVRKEVFGRPGAVPNLLRFIFASQPQHSKKNSRRSSFDVSDSLKGRSMLVAAIMDVITSDCGRSLDNSHFQSSLPANAEMGDIASAIQVIEGGMNLDDSQVNEDDDGGKGLKGIGMKVLGETTVVGLSRTGGLMEYADGGHVKYGKYAPKNLVHQKRHDNFLAEANLSSAVVPGLWDDLHSQHVAVPFAVWALANWAMASEVNRVLIQELDQDGHAVMTAIAAPERSVKWHGSLVARLLLEDNNLPLNDSVSDWSFNLLSTISQACKTEDIPLAQMALSAFLISVVRSPGARKVVMEKGLHLMRETAKDTTKHKSVQEALAKALELISTCEIHLSLEESQKWSGILLPWACGKLSSEETKSSAIKILSCILEDYGPSLVPVSQGWLAFLLTEMLGTVKATSMKGNTQPKNDKVKSQINHGNISSAAQIANQLASAVVNLARNQPGSANDSAETSPLADLLSQEPFAGPFKNFSKDRNLKFHVADSAVATLKGIKALAEVCSEDPIYQNKITDNGVLCLLRRYLLCDDYEKLAAIEAYDASRAREMREQASKASNESKVLDDKDSSSFRIPPTAHIRRHAARLLTILSALPKVQKVIRGDKAWCNWLEECANGRIPGCNDPKIQSYARATLLNVLCTDTDDSDSGSSDSVNGTDSDSPVVPRYDDMIILINPESSHWKCPSKPVSGTLKKNTSSTVQPSYVDRSSTDKHDEVEEDRPLNSNADHANLPNCVGGYKSCLETEFPPFDVIFVHGLRGGPFKTWRLSENKSSTKSGLVEKIDEEAGKEDSFWPGEWLPADFPHARFFTLKYKTNLTQWSGASLPLQEVSSMLLGKLVAARIGERPVVFVTHSMGGLVVKQILHQAKAENLNDLVNNTVGVVFYSCPHFGSKLADMPWRMGLVLRPAPTIGELRSGSQRLVELNDFIRRLHKKGLLEVLSFCETKVTPIVEGYGGWALRMEIVSIESAYPGFGDLVVLESTDHINSCKPLNRDDPSYRELLDFLRKLKAQYA
ncbi:hypothetical protein Ancab_016290 [Ancistrocladus abbreviatus]